MWLCATQMAGAVSVSLLQYDDGDSPAQQQQPGMQWNLLIWLASTLCENIRRQHWLRICNLPNVSCFA
jgi:hypothetical protein